MKKIRITVEFDDKYSISSVNQDVVNKLGDLSSYYGMIIRTDACKQILETDEEANKRLNEGETFYAW